MTFEWHYIKIDKLAIKTEILNIRTNKLKWHIRMTHIKENRQTMSKTLQKKYKSWQNNYKNWQIK